MLPTTRSGPELPPHTWARAAAAPTAPAAHSAMRTRARMMVVRMEALVLPLYRMPPSPRRELSTIGRRRALGVLVRRHSRTMLQRARARQLGAEEHDQCRIVDPHHQHDH